MDFCCCIEHLNVDMEGNDDIYVLDNDWQAYNRKTWLRWFGGDDELVSKLDSVASEVSTGSFPLKLDRSKVGILTVISASSSPESSGSGLRILKKSRCSCQTLASHFNEIYQTQYKVPWVQTLVSKDYRPVKFSIITACATLFCFSEHVSIMSFHFC